MKNYHVWILTIIMIWMMGIFTYVAISVMNEHQNSILPASSVATTTPENQCDIYTTDFYDTSKQPWKMLPACALVEKDDGGWCDGHLGVPRAPGVCCQHALRRSGGCSRVRSFS